MYAFYINVSLSLCACIHVYVYCVCKLRDVQNEHSNFWSSGFWYLCLVNIKSFFRSSFSFKEQSLLWVNKSSWDLLKPKKDSCHGHRDTETPKNLSQCYPSPGSKAWCHPKLSPDKRVFYQSSWTLHKQNHLVFFCSPQSAGNIPDQFKHLFLGEVVYSNEIVNQMQPHSGPDWSCWCPEKKIL